VWVVPLFVLVFEIMGEKGADHQPGGSFTPLDPLGWALLALGAAALLARRRRPVPVLAATVVTAVLFHLREYPQGPFFVAFVTALVGAVLAGRRLAAWITTSAVIGGYLLLAWWHPPVPLIEARRPSLALATLLCVWAFALVAGAELARSRSERAAEARRAMQEQRRRVASEERVRIARELHDVLAHNISMINVQAGVALHLMDDDPGQARTALTAIKAASKEALTEMRSVIAVLRQGESAPKSPTAGLERLDALVEAARTAGMRVTVERAGASRELPAGVDLAVFRIIQESLTNAARHARPPASGALAVRITLRQEADAVVVRIDDDGIGGSVAVADGGSGILGMKERAGALDGSFTAGPRPGGGFRVEARIPVSTPAPAPVPAEGGTA
jgi:MYXO-CTERM domain-containing protein